ncbi:MAG: hypothetical protein R2779_09205 [Crocinitomicaceae bacterium]
MIGHEIQTAAYLFGKYPIYLKFRRLTFLRICKTWCSLRDCRDDYCTLATVAGEGAEGHVYILAAVVIASLSGVALARKVEMTAMPQLIAILQFCWVWRNCFG